MAKKTYKEQLIKKEILNEEHNFRGTIKPPEASDLEMQVIGALMIDSMIINDVLQILSSKDFYNSRLAVIFEAAADLNEKGEPVDATTITEELKRRAKLEYVGGQEFIFDIVSGAVTSANTMHCARIIHEKRLLRELIHLSSIITEKALDPTTNTFNLLDSAERQILEISESLSKKKVLSIQEEIQDLFQELANRRSNKSSITGVATGYTMLDDLTSGFQKSELIVIAGRPSHGKTAFAMNIARNAAVDHNKSIAIFSLEMAARELMIRMLASEANVDGKRLKTGRLPNDEWEKVARSYHKLKTKIYIDDTSELSVLELRAKARRLKQDNGLDMVIVDYLQLVKGMDNPERRDLEVGYVSRSLKALAKELDIPVVACAQLNRGVEQRGGKEKKHPQLSDLRESGSIEQDADVVIFVYRPHFAAKEDEVSQEDYRRADITIGKQRNGPTDSFELVFLRESAKFVNKSKTPDISIPESTIESNDF